MIEAMSFDSHPEGVGTLIVIGALLLGVVRFLIAWRLQPETPQWPPIVIGLLGIGFAVTRLVHYQTTDPETALLVIRIQYGIGLVLPGFGMAALETMSRGVVSPRTFAMVGAGVLLFATCVATPWLVHGSLHVRLDAFGHEHLGAEPGIGAAIVLPLSIGVTIVELRRLLLQMTGELARQRWGFIVGAVLFAVAGLNDSLLGAGAIRSVFVLEYVFVAFGLFSANYELRRTALLHVELLRQLDQKRDALEDREASLQRTTARLDRSNLRYRHLANATREGVILCSGVRVLDVNEAAVQLLGGSRFGTGELRSVDLRTFVVDCDREQLERMLDADLGPVEMEVRRADGSIIPVSAKSIAAPEGSRGTRVLLFRDVCAERDLQRRLATADRLAAVGTLAAGTAHEINNPLAFVIANTELLEESVTELGLPSAVAADHRDMLADVRVGAFRIRDIVRDLMSLARDRGGTTEPVDVGETLRRSIAMAGPQVKHRARVVTCIDDVGAVNASEGRLFQVFLNLIVNAAQAIPEGSVDRHEITVVATREGGWITIAFTDTGSGMPESVRAHIFEPFFTTKEIGQGTGLGLSISMGIVTDLGGRIEVDSTVGVGTTFRVLLPAARERASMQRQIVEAEVKKRLRVLVIDDEHAVARSIARMLDSHEVEISHSGRTAFDQLVNTHFDVAVCDVMMPDVTGIQLYRQLRDVKHPIIDRFLFMTGGVSTREAEQFLEEIGGNRWVAKPIPMHELRRRVSELGMV